MISTKDLTAVEAIDKMLEDYQCHWPPRPIFTEWPASWQGYQRLCDVMPQRLCNFGETPEEFRDWLVIVMKQEVILEDVMTDIRKHYRKDDRRLLGFFGCLVFLKNAYRWGALPAVQSERERTTMTFPEILDAPLQEIAKLHGVAPYGTVFGMIIANTIYEEDKPSRMRFHFNDDPKIIQSEENFFLPFVTMENMFQSAVSDMREYMIITNESRNSRPAAVKHLSKRYELLTNIKKTLAQASKVFSYYTQGTLVCKEDWARFVQVPTTWGIGGKGGASGGETFIFQLLDEFLHIPGKCLMFRSKPLRREHMAESVCDILYAMSNSDHTIRFDSFLGLNKREDPIWQMKEEITKTLHLWRLNHAHVVRRFVAASEGLASTLDKKMDIQESLAITAQEELLMRARETIAQNIPKPSQKEKVRPPNINERSKFVGTYKNILHFVSSYVQNIVEFVLPVIG